MKNFFLCPLPEDQKPINLYLKTKENLFLSWTTFSEKAYHQRLFSFVLFNFLLIFVLRFPLLQSLSYFGEWILINSLVNFVSFNLFLIFLVACWKQVEKEFQSPYIVYEETSWSDAERWEKPSSIQRQDHLINQQKVTPVIQRLIRTIFQISTLTFGSLLLLKIS
jgi:hypothetical protein